MHERNRDPSFANSRGNTLYIAAVMALRAPIRRECEYSFLHLHELTYRRRDIMCCLKRVAGGPKSFGEVIHDFGDVINVYANCFGTGQETSCTVRLRSAPKPAAVPKNLFAASSIT
jgi:hypothetical protein